MKEQTIRLRNAFLIGVIVAILEGLLVFGRIQLLRLGL
ncbi:hypothetical protein LEP1GSC024_1488 [Leptospira noguchii str. 2001034031]|uniref:Uncharacterized protein n=1 Tax=Leptospira noguchii str. 2001034031 TaxID=1193053 RepID=M6YCI3_9LEPT|nr:hypothetical protein LEP1GSC024_1488 [Leptospira noguchii str. 2001034031]